MPQIAEISVPQRGWTFRKAQETRERFLVELHPIPGLLGMACKFKIKVGCDILPAFCEARQGERPKVQPCEQIFSERSVPHPLYRCPVRVCNQDKITRAFSVGANRKKTFFLNGSEFVATSLQVWRRKVGINPIQIYPDSPWENEYNEPFNGTLRREILNAEYGSRAVDTRVDCNVL